MELSNKTYIAILFTMILGLSLITFFQFRNFGKSMQEVTMPEFEIPEVDMEDLYSHEDSYAEEDWVSPDGKVKLTYSDDWLKSPELLLDRSTDLKVISENTELLFFAQKLNIKSQSMAFLTINKLPEKKTLEEITESLANLYVAEDYEIDIDVIEESEERVAWLEIVSQDNEGTVSFSELKALFAEDAVYLAIISTSQEDWDDIKENISKVLTSFDFVN